MSVWASIIAHFLNRNVVMEALKHLLITMVPVLIIEDEDGFPHFSKRFELRIDRDSTNGHHIHYMRQNHIQEARLPGP